MDSGATATFITKQMACNREYKLDAIVGGPNVTWGDASVSTPIKHTTWMNDSMKAFIVEGLEDCLITRNKAMRCCSIHEVDVSLTIGVMMRSQ